MRRTLKNAGPSGPEKHPANTDGNAGPVLFIYNANYKDSGEIISSKKWVNDHLANFESVVCLGFVEGYRFDVLIDDEAVKRIRIKTNRDLEKILRKYRISSIFVSQLFGMDTLKTAALIASSRVPFIYFIHDYACLCPSGRLVHEGESMYSGRDCSENPLCDFRAELETWRAAFADFLNKASELYASGETAKDMVLKVYPRLSITVPGGRRVRKLFNVNSGKAAESAVLNIGVLGLLHKDKGQDVICYLAEEILRRDLRIRIKVIGRTVIEPIPEKYKDVIETYEKRYAYYELPALVREKDISFFLFPSIWPETYSHVCGEIVQMGFPALIFDMGGQKERIGNGGFGWLIDPASGPKGMLDKILELNENRNLILEKARTIRERNQERIDIILPVFNAYEHLQRCAGSLIKNTDFSSRLTIIEDCSTDERVRAYLKNLESDNPYLEIEVVYNDRNLGFLKSVNKGLKRSREHCVIINSDTIVPPNWLSRMIHPLKSDLRIASATPYSNSGAVCSFPELREYNNMIAGESVRSLDSLFQTLGENDFIDIPSGIGFCMLMNRNVINEIGCFDEKTFGAGYGEENDWCVRAAKKGYRNVHIQNLFVYHRGNGSFGSGAVFQKEENLAALYKKHPGYRNAVAEFIKADPAQENRASIKKLIPDYFDRKETRVYSFFHIPKTAGSTLRKHLEKCFGEERVFQAYSVDKPDLLKKAGRLSVSGPKGIKVIIGHYNYFRLGSRLGEEVQNITFLRNPADTMVSLFNYYRDYYRAMPGKGVKLHKSLFSILDERGNFISFEEWFKKEAWLHNFITRYLLGFDEDVFHADGLDKALTAGDFESAKKVLDRMSFVGMYENFDEDSTFLFRQLGISEQYESYNVTPKSFVPEDIKEIEALIDLLSPFDKEIYQYGLQLNRRFKEKVLNLKY